MAADGRLSMGRTLMAVLILVPLALFTIVKQRQDLAPVVNFVLGENGTDEKDLLAPPGDEDRVAFVLENERAQKKKRIARLRTRNRRRPILLRPAVSSRTRSGKIIYYLHLHKAAGTTVCHAVQKAGLSVNWSQNCNVQRDQRCCGGNDSLEAQIRYAKTTKFDFVANERDMYEAMATDHYHYTVMLRNSRDRYVSHWRHVWRLQIGATSFDDWYERQPDNWTVRKICGTRCLGIPKYQLSKEDWTYTVDRLMMFESILFLESFNESYRKVATQLNFTNAEPPVIKHQASTAKDPDPPLADWDPLMSVLDDALYEIAQRKDKGEDPATELSSEMQQLLDRYFAEGKEKGCKNPCCAMECSKYR